MDLDMYSPAEGKALAITPMVSGSASFLCSALLLIMIFMSKTKLNAPSRRILCGLCIYDCLSSVASAFSSLPVPEEERIWGAMGNVMTCDIQGFFMHFGCTGSVFYNCNLIIFYLCSIKFSMSETTFRKKVEPFCHLIPNAYALGGAVYLFANGYFNNIGNICWVGPNPINCINDPEVECVRGGEDAYRLRWIFYGYSAMVVFFIIILSIIMISWKVFFGARNSNRQESECNCGVSRRLKRMRKPDDDLNDNDLLVQNKDSNDGLIEFPGAIAKPKQINSSKKHGIIDDDENGDNCKREDEKSFNSVSAHHNQNIPKKGENEHKIGELDNMAAKPPRSMSVNHNQSIAARVTPGAQSDHNDGDKSVTIINARPQSQSLTFDLKAMRAKAGAKIVNKDMLSQDVLEKIEAQTISVRQSLRRASAPCYIPSHFSRKHSRSCPSRVTCAYVDPNPFNVKAVRNKVHRASQIKAIQNPPERPLRASSRITRSVIIDLGNAGEESSENQPTSSSEGQSLAVHQMTTRENLDRVMKIAATQALLYALAFTLTWVFAFATRITEQRNGHPPFVIFFLSRLFNPLQGVMNVLIHTRPQATLLRKKYKYTWVKAIYQAVRSGGDGDIHRHQVGQNYTRASTTLFSDGFLMANPDDASEDAEVWEFASHEESRNFAAN